MLCPLHEHHVRWLFTRASRQADDENVPVIRAAESDDNQISYLQICVAGTQVADDDQTPSSPGKTFGKTRMSQELRNRLRSLPHTTK